MSVERHAEAMDRLRIVLRRRAPLAAAVFALVFVAGAAVGLALPPLYRAVAVFEVEPGRGDPGLPDEVAARLETIGQTVLSRSPLLEQARRFGLYPELASRGLGDAIVEQMKRDIRVETRTTPDPGGRGTLVGLSLSYRGRDPKTAAQVSNSLAALYLQQDAVLRSQRYAGRAGLIQQRLAEMKERLDGYEARALGRGQTRSQGPRGHVDAAAALDRLSLQLRTVREDRLRAIERREGLLKQIAEADPHADLAARLARMRQDLAQRRQKLTDRHPDVLLLEAEIASLEKEAAAPRTAPPSEGAAGSHLREMLDETDAAIRTAKLDEERLSGELAAAEERLKAAPSAEASEPDREVPAFQEIYGSLLRRYEDAQLADSAEETLASRLKLLDPAAPPLRDVAPPRERLFLFALFSAFFAAVAAGALAERLDRTIRSLDDLRAFTRVPVLATVPALATPLERRRRRLLVSLSLVGLVAGVTLVGLGSYHLFARGYWLSAAFDRPR